MQAIRHTFISAVVFFTFISWVHAGTTELTQIKFLIKEIKNSNSHKYQGRVYLGGDQNFAQLFEKTINNSITVLTNLTTVLERNLLIQGPKNLQWMPASNQTPVKGKLVNTGASGEKIHICRAEFLGPHSRGKALYPGQLITEGCRITYAGYAFIITKFEALTGNNSGLEWIPIRLIKSHIIMEKKQKDRKSKMNNQNKSVALGPEGVTVTRAVKRLYPIAHQSAQNDIESIKVNNARPISGGYVRGRSVLICRAKKNGHHIIGKLVFFDTRYACDIGINDKEIVISGAYDILFWKTISVTLQNAHFEGSRV